jgi:hypothetical protein
MKAEIGNLVVPCPHCGKKATLSIGIYTHWICVCLSCRKFLPSVLCKEQCAYDRDSLEFILHHWFLDRAMPIYVLEEIAE